MTKPRVGLAANQEDETDAETFQMESDKETGKCTFRTSQGSYWALVAHGGIQSTATEVTASAIFSVEWISHKMALRANNGKYVCTKRNGQLLAVSDSPGEDELLTLKLINRPLLILRGERGFICHHRSSNTLDSNRSTYDIFTLQFSNGAYHIRGLDGRFWYVDGGGLVCSDGEAPENFSLELHRRGRLAIRGRDGRYVHGDPGGTLKGDGLSLSSSALWEY